MKKFKSAVVDNPWRYSNTKTGGSLKSGADHHYNTLSYDELKNLPVKKIMDKNSVLFLWVPVPLKYEIATSGILESWRYKYKTTIYWEKMVQNGLGFWYRGAIEECWVCTRGKVTPFRTQKTNIVKTYYTEKEWEEELIKSIPGRHSEKPEVFWELIEPSVEKFDLNPKIELFARKIRRGWCALGNEITGNDIRVDLKRSIDE